MTRRLFLALASSVPLAALSTRISYGKAPQQFGVLRLPQTKGPYPAVIGIHGGFWRNAYGLNTLDPLCVALASAGAATWNIEYRRLGDPGGDWDGMSDDIVRGSSHIVTLAARYNLDMKRIVAAGHSAGGQLALWLAAQQTVDIRGVAGLAAVSDLRRAFALQLNDGVVRRLLGGSPDQVPQRYSAASPIELLPISVAQRLVHGTADNVVPFEMSERFAKASKNSKLISLPGAGHFDLVDPQAKSWPVVQRAILDWDF